MARFLAAIAGNRGEETRLGTPHSGIRAQAQGWNVGVKIFGNAHGNVDEFRVYVTGGSNGGTSPELIGYVVLGDDGYPAFFPANSTDLPASYLDAVEASGV